MASHLFRATPLNEPKPVYFQLDAYKLISLKVEVKLKFSFRKTSATLSRF